MSSWNVNITDTLCVKNSILDKQRKVSDLRDKKEEMAKYDKDDILNLENYGISNSESAIVYPETLGDLSESLISLQLLGCNTEEMLKCNIVYNRMSVLDKRFFRVRLEAGYVFGWRIMTDFNIIKPDGGFVFGSGIGVVKIVRDKDDDVIFVLDEYKSLLHVVDLNSGEILQTVEGVLEAEYIDQCKELNGYTIRMKVYSRYFETANLVAHREYSVKNGRVRSHDERLEEIAEWTKVRGYMISGITE